MLRVNAGSVRVSADFTFFAVIALFLCFDVTGYGILSLLACLVHESGHLFAMLILGEKPNEIVFRGGGVKISAAGWNLPVLAAGSFLNVALFFILYFTLPKTDIYPVMFAVLNLVIGVFNLLPIGCLDGKRIISLFLSEKIVSAVEKTAFAAAVLAVFTAFFFGKVNFTLIIVLFYIMAIDIFFNV